MNAAVRVWRRTARRVTLAQLRDARHPAATDAPYLPLRIEKDRKMKVQHVVLGAFAAIASAMSVQAHEVDPGGKVEVACAADSVRMAAVTSAVERSHYWASQTARRQMLSLAQQACARGATLVTFVPPADQRFCQTPPKWSTLCVDRSATGREAGQSSTASSSSMRE